MMTYGPSRAAITTPSTPVRMLASQISATAPVAARMTIEPISRTWVAEQLQAIDKLPYGYTIEAAGDAAIADGNLRIIFDFMTPEWAAKIAAITPEGAKITMRPKSPAAPAADLIFIVPICPMAPTPISRLDAIACKDFNQKTLVSPLILKMFGEENDGWCESLDKLMRIMTPSEWDLFHKEMTTEEISVKSKVLLWFICNRQFVSALVAASKIEEITTPLSLQLRDGSCIKADSTSSLAKQLWAKSEPKGKYTWIGKADDLREAITALEDFAIYELNDAFSNHVKLLQKIDSQFYLFDTNLGLRSGNIRHLHATTDASSPAFYGIIHYGTQRDPGKFMSLADLPKSQADTLLNSAIFTCDDLHATEELLKHPAFKPIDKLIAERPTLLTTVCRNGCTNALKALIGHGANIHGVDRLGNTLLHEAAVSGHTELIQVLLASGATAQLQKKSHPGMRPLDLAVHFGHQEAVALIRQAMAGESALVFASTSTESRTVKPSHSY